MLEMLSLVKLGSFDKLKIVGFTDASFQSSDEMTKSVGGRVLFLMNENASGLKYCSLHLPAGSVAAF